MFCIFFSSRVIVDDSNIVQKTGGNSMYILEEILYILFANNLSGILLIQFLPPIAPFRVAFDFGTFAVIFCQTFQLHVITYLWEGISYPHEMFIFIPSFSPHDKSFTYNPLIMRQLWQLPY